MVNNEYKIMVHRSLKKWALRFVSSEDEIGMRIGTVRSWDCFDFAAG